MWVKVAVKNRVAHRLVAIAAAVVGDFQRISRSGKNQLAVEVSGFGTVGRFEPLMRVQMVHMSRPWPGV